jgi:hypothetical protein
VKGWTRNLEWAVDLRVAAFVVLVTVANHRRKQMRYALLICTNEKDYEDMGPEEGAALMAAYSRWSDEMNDRGILQTGERLRPTTDATTVRLRDGETLTSDGPFAETKEQVGGFFLVDCKDLDEAIEIAAKIPSAAHGSIEVRPIWEIM